MTHELKCWPEFYVEIDAGRKTFEIRDNDRAFQVGDILLLREFDQRDGFTGRSCKRVVSYKTDFQQRPGFVVLALRALQEQGEESEDTHGACLKRMAAAVAHALDENLEPRNRLQGVIARLRGYDVTSAEQPRSTEGSGETPTQEVKALVDSDKGEKNMRELCEQYNKMLDLARSLAHRLEAAQQGREFQSARIDQIIVEEAAAQKALKERAKAAESKLSRIEAETVTVPKDETLILNAQEARKIGRDRITISIPVEWVLGRALLKGTGKTNHTSTDEPQT